MRSKFDKQIEAVIDKAVKDGGVEYMEALQDANIFTSMLFYPIHNETFAKDGNEAIARMFDAVEGFPDTENDLIESIKILASDIALTADIDDKMTAPLLASAFIDIIEYLKDAADMRKLREENKNMRTTITSLMEALRGERND